MKIEKIYIACHKYDLRLARICVASIRYWYPEIPIYLIKDHFNGNFSTAESERAWNVRVFETSKRIFGWGMSKLEPVFSDNGGRFLVLDSDTVFIGRVLDRLDEFSENFVVHFEEQPAQRVKEIYFDVDKLHEFDPTFIYSGHTFNTGQYVATGGILRREDFAAVNWEVSPPTLKDSEIFKNGEQGVLNYVLLKKAATSELTLASVPFMRWPGYGIDDIDIGKFNDTSPYQNIIHWAGLTRPRISAMPRSDILEFFEDYYYSRISMGQLVKGWRSMGNSVANMKARTKRRLLRSNTGSRMRPLDQQVTGPVSSS
jgi:lipopolysaccharide biosynthesis glycosyltransferase